MLRFLAFLVITNLLHELRSARIEATLNSAIDLARALALAPDAVVLAIGSTPYVPQFEGSGTIQVIHAETVLRTPAAAGAAVLVYDIRSDWIGLGIAELLAQQGSRVILAVNGTHAGENVPLYVRDDAVGRLHRLGVELRPYSRFYGCNADTVYLRHTASGEPVLIEGIDTVVLCTGRQADGVLYQQLSQALPEVVCIGDALAPRTVEEAIYEGLRVGTQL